MKFINITSWNYTSPSFYDEPALANAIANIGPIAVSVYATSKFQSYSSGVFTDTTCNVIKTVGFFPFPDINHAVRNDQILLIKI